MEASVNALAHIWSYVEGKTSTEAHGRHVCIKKTTKEKLYVSILLG